MSVWAFSINKKKTQKISSKLAVILGPTASGKSDLAVRLAKKFNGEIISADSRQVYKGLDIGSGKITKKEMRGVPHHLLDVANPKRKFTVAQYQKLALRAIRKIQRRSNLPFLVGGSGFYIQSVVDNLKIPEVKPNWKLRRKLEKKPARELFLMLKKLDPRRAKTIDSKNPRRLVRAIEIAITHQVARGRVSGDLALRKPPRGRVSGISGISGDFTVLQIGIKRLPKELKKAIYKRLLKRLNPPIGGGMIEEVRNLHRNGLSWKRLEELGLEYRLIARLLRYAEQAKHSGQAQRLQSKLTYKEMIDKLEKEIWRFSKRQMTWFKRDKRIKWIKSQKEAEKLIKKNLLTP